MSMSFKRKPQTSDGRDILMVTKFRGDVDPYFAGCGDDPTVLPGSNGRAEGPDFVDGWATVPSQAEDKSFEFQFNDWVYIAGGDIRWTGGKAGDWVDFDMYCPATVTTLNSGGTGNCNLAPQPSGYSVIVPAGGDGFNDVADSAKMPIPAYDADGKSNGYWDWDEPDEGRGTIVPNAQGKGNCNLLNIPVELVHWVARQQLIGDGVKNINPETKARKIYPHWKFRLKLHNAGASGPFHVAWTLDLARKKTT